MAKPGCLALGVLPGGDHSRDGRPAAMTASAPREVAASSGTPWARIAGSAGSSSWASRACTSAQRAVRQHGGRSGRRSRRAGGARRVQQDGGKVPGLTRRRGGRSLPRGQAAAGAAPNLPGASDPLAVTRAAAVAAVAGSTWAQAGMQRGGALGGEQAAGFGAGRSPGSGMSASHRGQRGEIHARAAASGSAIGRRHPIHPSRPAPRCATRRRCRPRRPGGRHTGDEGAVALVLQASGGR